MKYYVTLIAVPCLYNLKRIVLSQILVLCFICLLERNSAGFLPCSVLSFLFSIWRLFIEGSSSVRFWRGWIFLSHITSLAIIIPWRSRSGRRPGKGRQELKLERLQACYPVPPPQQCICFPQFHRRTQNPFCRSRPYAPLQG